MFLRGALPFFSILFIASSSNAAVPLPNQNALPPELRKVPDDLCAFTHVRFEEIWDHPAAQSLRKGFTTDWESNATAQALIRLLDNVETVTAFMLPHDDQEDWPRGALIVTTLEPYQREDILAAIGWDQEVPPDVQAVPLMGEIVLHFTSERMFAFVLRSWLSAFEQDVQRAEKARLPTPIRLAASGEVTAVLWMNRANSPSVWLRGLTSMINQGPPEFRRLMKAESLLARLTVGETLTARLVLRYGSEEELQTNIEGSKQLLKQIDQLARFYFGWAKGRPKVHAVELLGIKHFIKLLESIKIEPQATEMRVAAQVKLDATIGEQIDEAFRIARKARPAYLKELQLKQLGLALHNYHVTFGKFPPAIMTDGQGKPTFSWRAAILPFVEQENLSRALDFNQPWDSPRNRDLTTSRLRIFSMRGTKQKVDTKTHYRVFVGKEAAFDAKGSRTFADITDGLSNTIFIVEAAEAVEWAKPEPLVYDPKKPLPKLLYDEEGYTRVLMGDGSVHRLKKPIDEKALRALITRNGEERLPDSVFEDR